MMRIAIAGAGAIAERAHLPALRAIAGVEVVAIQSRTAAKAERLAAMLWPASDASPRPRCYADYGRMLERERPDAVGVFTPNNLHYEFTVKALHAGAHVLVEKPMAPTAAEARAMAAAARQAGRVLMVAMQRRYGPFERAIKRALDSGAIGAPHFIRARLSHSGPDFWAPGQQWFFDRAQAGGGAMLDLGVHVADLALWLMGEAAVVSGLTGTLVRRIETEDNGAMLVRFRSGALGVIEASWSSAPMLSALEIYAERGRILMGYPRLDIAIQKPDGSAPPGYSREEILGAFDPADRLAPGRALAQNFVDAAAGKATPSPDGADGLRAVELIEACYRSSRSGHAVSLPLE